MMCGFFAAGHGAAAFAHDSFSVLAQQPESTSVSAYQNAVAWSAFDPASQMYRLMARVGGRVVAVRAAPRAVPFDVDVGPDALGRPVVTFSRCAREPRAPFTPIPDYTGGRGCSLREATLPDGTERALPVAVPPGFSAVRPTVWGSRLAFVADADRAPRRVRMYMVERPSGRQRRVLTFRGDPSWVSVVGVDLRGRQLAYTLRGIRNSRCSPRNGKSGASSPISEVGIVDDRGRQQVIDRECDDLGPSFGAPSLGTDGLLYEAFEIGSPGPQLKRVTSRRCEIVALPDDTLDVSVGGVVALVRGNFNDDAFSVGIVERSRLVDRLAPPRKRTGLLGLPCPVQRTSRVPSAAP